MSRKRRMKAEKRLPDACLAAWFPEATSIETGVLLSEVSLPGLSRPVVFVRDSGTAHVHEEDLEAWTRLYADRAVPALEAE